MFLNQALIEVDLYESEAQPDLCSEFLVFQGYIRKCLKTNSKQKHPKLINLIK